MAFVGATVFCPHPKQGVCIFVSRRGAPEDLGGIPGGKLDPEETPSAAAHREFQEETGFQLSGLSPEPLFTSVARETNALCHAFLGRLSPDDWAALITKAGETGYAGPEGLVVRVAPWRMMMDEDQVAFADFNCRFFQHIRASASSQDLFEALGLGHIYADILKQS